MRGDLSDEMMQLHIRLQKMEGRQSAEAPSIITALTTTVQVPTVVPLLESADITEIFNLLQIINGNISIVMDKGVEKLDIILEEQRQLSSAIASNQAELMGKLSRLEELAQSQIKGIFQVLDGMEGSWYIL